MTRVRAAFYDYLELDNSWKGFKQLACVDKSLLPWL